MVKHLKHGKIAILVYDKNLSECGPSYRFRSEIEVELEIYTDPFQPEFSLFLLHF